MINVELVNKKFENIKGLLNERALRIWCATEADAIGRGGITLLCRATGISRVTITKGIKELNSTNKLSGNKLRKAGGGRKKLTVNNTNLLKSLDQLINPATRGDPEKPLLWSSKSTYNLSAELKLPGYKVSQRSVYTNVTKH